MIIESKSDIGNIVLSNKAFRDIAEISALKVEGIYPVKKNDFAEVKLKDEKFYVTLHIKLKQNVDVVKTCTKAQTRVREALEDMIGIPVSNVNIDIQGFVTEKESREERKKKEKDKEKEEPKE